MSTNTLALASDLSDQDLLARIVALAGNERQASVELIAHLAALDARPSLYAAQGFGSLFGYCTHVLRLSEDATSNRIEAARACRRFPVILDLLACGSVSLTAVRLLRPRLTEENHEAVLARAKGMSRRHIDALVAELAPRPDVASTVRRLPTPKGTSAPTVDAAPGSAPPVVVPMPASQPPGTAEEASIVDAPEPVQILTPPRPPARAVIDNTSPDRYRVQFTIGRDTHDKLRRLQALLRREIPNGDPAAIFDRAVTLLLEKVETAKLGKAAKPRPIRPGADKSRSRHIPNQSKRVAWTEEGGQCGFVAPSGQRCTERTFLEFHHVEPYALGGPPTPDNIALRCRRHNQYEAERVFGPRGSARDDRWSDSGPG
jgi:hypothetical protein